MSNTIEAIWVAGRYKGERARSVMAHSHEGIGYYDVENIGTRNDPEIVAYFRAPIDGEPLPEHLAEVRDPYKISKLEKQRLSRMGVNDRPEVKRATDKTIKQVKDIFFRKQKA